MLSEEEEEKLHPWNLLTSPPIPPPPHMNVLDSYIHIEK